MSDDDHVFCSDKKNVKQDVSLHVPVSRHEMFWYALFATLGAALGGVCLYLVDQGRLNDCGYVLVMWGATMLFLGLSAEETLRS